MVKGEPNVLKSDVVTNMLTDPLKQQGHKGSEGEKEVEERALKEAK